MAIASIKLTSGATLQHNATESMQILSEAYKMQLADPDTRFLKLTHPNEIVYINVQHVVTIEFKEQP